jgi:diguanylate cyclase (GGDEF)-like protein/PAS domain S-box-containing protein
MPGSAESSDPGVHRPTADASTAGPNGTGPADEASAQRQDLTTRWATAMATSAYLPMPQAEVERRTLGLLDEICQRLRAERFRADTAEPVGQRLVTAGFTGPHSLSRSIELLGNTLPTLPELAGVRDLPERVTSLLAALSAGYVRGLREWLFAQQEEVKQALVQAREKVERGLRASEARFREVFAASAVGIAITDFDGRFVETNEALSEILGYAPAEFAELGLDRLFPRADLPEIEAGYHQVRTGETARLHQRRRLVCQDGQVAWAQLRVSLLRDADGRPRYHVTMVEDTTELTLLQGRLGHQVLHDALTALPNREYYASRLETALGRVGAAPLTLLHLDLDGFGVVNDGLGEQAGDALLTSVARRLEAVVAGERAMVARLDGDTFAIMLQDGPDVGALAESINAALAEPVYLLDSGVALSASIGIARRTPDLSTPTELMTAADVALRRAKTVGTGQWALFDPAVDGQERSRLRIAATMPGAFETGQLDVEFVPVVRLAGESAGAVAAARARLRWDHPEHGSIGHQRCLDLAGRTGLLRSLGRWMLRACCEHAAAWPRQAGETPPVLEIPLAAAQARDPDLLAAVAPTLDATGLAPDRVRLSVPVGPLASGDPDAEDNLRVLAELGVRLSLHDVATGEDGLSCVEDYPMEAITLSPQLVDRVARRPDSLAARLATQLVPLVHACGAAVIVPALDDSERLAWWRAAGTDLGSGRHLGDATSPHDLHRASGSGASSARR